MEIGSWVEQICRGKLGAVMRMPYLAFNFSGRGCCKVPQRYGRNLEGGGGAINTAYDYGGIFFY